MLSTKDDGGSTPGELANLTTRIASRRRGDRLARAVESGLRRWRTHGVLPSTSVARVLAHRPRIPVRLERPKRFAVVTDAEVTLPRMEQETFKAPLHRVLARLITFTAAAFYYYGARFIDRLRQRDTEERQAVRLREIVERIGGTAIKAGQQMAMRVDLVPFCFGAELSKMLDRVPPMKTADAVDLIQRQLGRRLDQVFAAFDPEPVGSASVACVYQAITHGGDKVAIKVRRPGVGEMFAADCAALAVVMDTLEMLTIVREGFSASFLYEFRTMLLEELDFGREARSTELFRRNVRKKLRHVSAPRVYFEYSGNDVLVTEFVSGIWMGELIAAVEYRDPAALARLRQLNIDPQTVAKRLIRTNQFGIFENLLFHADPHPSNVLVQPNNTLVFVDFGACGAYTSRERINWRRLAHYHSQADIGRMVQAALAILEPLPPIDIDTFMKRLEAVFWRDLYAFKSHHAQWWERTSARIWMSFLDLTREFEIPMNLNTLRMIRSTLLYETVAARLYPGINAYKEHHRYNRAAGKRARKRVRRAIHKRIFEGFTNVDYLKIEELMHMGGRIMYLTQRFLDTPPFRFSLLASKVVYFVVTAVRGVMLVVGLDLVIALSSIGVRLRRESTYHWSDVNLWRTMLHVLLDSRVFQAGVVLILIFSMRRVRFRLRDRDVDGDMNSGLS